MHAVVKTGGKQYRVRTGETLKVEKLELNLGDSVDFDQVLLVSQGEELKIGAPVVEGAKVTAEVVAHGRGDKITIVKFHRRKHHRKQMGHRQWFTQIKITDISA